MSSENANRLVGSFDRKLPKKLRLKWARANGPRGMQDRGKVFQGLRWGIYVGTDIVLRPVKQGCWR